MIEWACKAVGWATSESPEDRRVPSQVVDAARQQPAKRLAEEVRRVLRDQPAVAADRASGGRPAGCQWPDRAAVPSDCPDGGSQCRPRGGSRAQAEDQAVAHQRNVVGLSLSSSTGWSLTSRQSRSPGSTAIILQSRPPMLWPTSTIRPSAASVASGEPSDEFLEIPPEEIRRVGDGVAGRVAERPELEASSIAGSAARAAIIGRHDDGLAHSPCTKRTGIFRGKALRGPRDRPEAGSRGVFCCSRGGTCQSAWSSAGSSDGMAKPAQKAVKMENTNFISTSLVWLCNRRSVACCYSPPINSPFSATGRSIRSTRSTSPRLRTANSQKTSK